MRKEARATAKALAHLSARPLCKRWRVHLPVSCDKKSGISRVVPFPGRRPAVEILRASEKPPAPCEKPARIGAKGYMVYLRVRNPVRLGGSPSHRLPPRPAARLCK